MTPAMPMTSSAGEKLTASRMSPQAIAIAYMTAEMIDMPRSDTSPYWMTREPPLNWVGRTFASSAPSLASKTSFATFRPRWTAAAPMIVTIAVKRSKKPCAAAIAMPTATGMRVADRNGSRVARRVSHPRPEARPDPMALLVGDAVVVGVRLAHGALDVLGEGDLGLVPAPGLVGAQGEPSVGCRRRRAPDGHVAALVVAEAWLRPDVAAGEADGGAGGDVEAGRDAERGRAGRLVDLGIDRGAHRDAVGVDPGQERERERRELREAVGRGERPGAGADVDHLRPPSRRRRRGGATETRAMAGAVRVSPSGQ